MSAQNLYGTTRQGQPFVSAKVIEIYLLRVLFEAQGSHLQAEDAIERIFNLIGHLFTEADYEGVGEENVERWRNNVFFSRLHLANDGLVIPHGQAPISHWELTEAGMEEAYTTWVGSESKAA